MLMPVEEYEKREAEHGIQTKKYKGKLQIFLGKNCFHGEELCEGKVIPENVVKETGPKNLKENKQKGNESRKGKKLQCK